MSKARVSLISGVLLATVALGAAPASAQPAAPTSAQSASSSTGEVKDRAGFTPSEYSELDAFLAENGVTPSTRNALLKKLKAGKAWDSWSESNLVKKTTKTDGDFKVTTSTYADGSISVTGAEQPTEVTSTGDFGTMAIKDCTTQTGSGYQVSRGCTVYATKGVIEFNFRADYSILQGSGNDKIIAVYNDEVRVVGGTASGRALVINRQNETSAQVAEARLSADITIGSSYTGTSSLYLQVGRNTAISKSTL